LTCYYYVDSGLRDFYYLWDGKDGSGGYQDAEGCPAHAKKSTTCGSVQSWRSLIDAL